MDVVVLLEQLMKNYHEPDKIGKITFILYLKMQGLEYKSKCMGKIAERL